MKKEEVEIPKFTKLKGFLTEHEMIAQDLANIIGCGETTIYAKLNGRKKWDWVDLMLIKKHFDLSVEDLGNLFFLN